MVVHRFRLSEARATDLLDESAIRLLADFFLLLAEWDSKRTNRNLGDLTADVTIRDGGSKSRMSLGKAHR
jgi:hypothetical protein